MIKSVMLGVKSDDLKKAKSWIEELTDLRGEAHESSFWGGDYYLFGQPSACQLKLFKNIDLYDREPIFDNLSDWKLLILAECGDEVTEVLRRLSSSATRFQHLDTVTDRFNAGED
jgi:hypothetical protein